MTGVGAPAGKVQPDAHRSPWRRLRPRGREGRLPSLIDEIVREGARRMLAEALQAEVDAYIAAHAAERDRTAAGWWSATAITSRGRY